MTSTTLLCPASIVQPFDQTYGTKEWIPRRRLIHTITPLPLPTMKAEGAHGKRREGGWRHDHQLSASRCFVTAAIEADVALQEAIAEAESSLETQTDDLEVLARVGLEAVTGKKSEKRDENLKQNSDRRLLEDKDVVAGAVFMGKVRSILSFGAFVDFGAFTDGLVHISQLSSAFVISVEDAVSVGQEVRVKILDVNFASKRIALSMKDLEDGGEQKRPTSAGSVRGVSGQTQGEGKGNSRGKTAGSVRGRQTEQKNKSSFQKGEQINGVVKNLTRRGAFVTLPGGEEGFLPATEIPGGERTPLQNLVPAGKEVSVRVLKVGGGKVSLSLKPVLDLASVNKAVNRDVEIEGGNAFEIAFRSNPAIRKYLTDLEAKSSQLMEEKLSVDHTTAAEDAFREDPSTPLIADEGEANEEKSAVSASVNPLADKFYEEENAAVVDKAEKVQVKEKVALDETIEITTSAENIIPLFPEENASSFLEVAAMEDKIDEARSEVAADEEANMETEREIHLVAEETTADTEERYLTSAKNITSNVEEAVVPSFAVMVATEGTESLVSDAATVRSTAFPETESTMPPKAIELLPSLSIGAKKNAASSAVAASTLSSAAVAALKEESTLKSSGAITSALIKKLRAETGAGMMDCKKALIETEGDLEEARDYLRKKGLASAEKKIGRIVAEGLIGNYIHDSRIGVLIEVNCETDFVSRGEIFKQLVEDLAMQVVANQQVDYVSVEDIPLEIQAKERELEMQREDLLNKPEQIRAKIVDGRLAKRFGELALLEQPFIKNDTLLVKDLVKQTVASLGENIHIRRFVRYTLGEGLEKKSEDFATGVAAQTTGKEVF